MTDKTNKITAKRLPRGQRIHVRRLKQETRNAGGTYKLANLNFTTSVKKV